jgi:hypothetical protein
MRTKTPTAGKPGRICAVPDCGVVLSVYNRTRLCGVHSYSDVVAAIDVGRWEVVGTDWTEEWVDAAKSVVDADSEAHARGWELAQATFRAMEAGVRATQLAARARREALPGKYAADVARFSKAWQEYADVPLDRRPSLWAVVKTREGQPVLRQYERIKLAQADPVRMARPLLKAIEPERFGDLTREAQKHLQAGAVDLVTEWFEAELARIESELARVLEVAS